MYENNLFKKLFKKLPYKYKIPFDIFIISTKK